MKDIYNYQFLSDNLSSSGMPTAGQMQAIADENVRVVINLAACHIPGGVARRGQIGHSSWG